MSDIDLDKALRNAEPALRQAFADMVTLMSTAIPLSELTTLLSTGRLEEALDRVLGLAPRLGNEFNRQFVEAANDVARQMNRRIGEIAVDFDMTNTRAVNVMRENNLRLVRQFSEQQRAATRRALIDGVERGLNPRQQAVNFRRSIGLTDKQMEYVNNYRRALETGSRNALDRSLRDKRFDPTVRRAIQDKTPLSAQQIDKMTNRYRDRWIKHRSETIGRTEALRAVHQANEEMFQQAFDDGTLDPNSIEREWNTAKDERVRGSHRAMHNQIVVGQAPFMSGAGNQLQYPTDPSAPAEDSINCRCRVGTRIVSLPEVTDTPTVAIF